MNELLGGYFEPLDRVWLAVFPYLQFFYADYLMPLGLYLTDIYLLAVSHDFLVFNKFVFSSYKHIMEAKQLAYG